MTATDEILALASFAATGLRTDVLDTAALDTAKADLAELHAAAARRTGSRVILALRALPGAPPAGPAWTAWLLAAAATAAAGEGGAIAARGTETAGPARPARFIVAAAAAALRDSGCDPAVVPAAIAAGTRAAGIVEAGLDDWDGWSAGTVSGAVGAALAAGSLLRLPGPQLRNALGICATQAAGLRTADGTDAGPLQAGKAAFNAVEAALLAQSGLTAPAEPLDGRRGLFALFG